MALGDVTVYGSPIGYAGTDVFAVAASATLINAGEPTLKLSGTSGNVVAPLLTSYPTSADASHLTGGIAMSTSTNTASAAGTVEVLAPLPQVSYLIAPKTTATWDCLAFSFA